VRDIPLTILLPDSKNAIIFLYIVYILYILYFIYYILCFLLPITWLCMLWPRLCGLSPIKCFCISACQHSCR